MESPLLASTSSRVILDSTVDKLLATGSLERRMEGIASRMDDISRARREQFLNLVVQLRLMRRKESMWICANSTGVELFCSDFIKSVSQLTEPVNTRLKKILSDSAAELAFRNPAYMRSYKFDPENHIHMCVELSLISEVQWGRWTRLLSLTIMVNEALTKALVSRQRVSGLLSSLIGEPLTCGRGNSTRGA